MALIGKSEMASQKPWCSENHGIMVCHLIEECPCPPKRANKNQGNFTSMVSQDSPFSGIPAINVLFPLVG